MAIAETTQDYENFKNLIFCQMSLNPSPGLVFINTIFKPEAAEHHLQTRITLTY